MAYLSEKKASALGAWSARPENRRLWSFSKRELVEMVLHLAAVNTASGADAALSDGTALARVEAERTALRRAGLI